MTLRHLKIFVSVFQYKSMTKAANSLSLAQPSVSLAIHELEDYYEIRLFDRISHHILPTEEGRHFYDYALHICSLFDELEKGIRNWDSLSSIRIGASTTIGTYLLPSAVKEFNCLYPDRKISVLIQNLAALEQAVLDNLIDFALIEGTVSSKQLLQKPLMEERFCLICGMSHPFSAKSEITPKELHHCDFLLWNENSSDCELLETMMALHHVKIAPLWESTSALSIIKAVSNGLGLSILPYLQVQQALKDGSLKELPIKGVDLNQPCFAIYHKNKYMTDSMRSFLSLFSFCIPAELTQINEQSTADNKNKN